MFSPGPSVVEEPKRDEAFPVHRHFACLTERALLHHPDVELLVEHHGEVIASGESVFVLSFFRPAENRLVYAEVRDPHGWILASSGESKYIELKQHLGDAEAEFTEEPTGDKAETLCGPDAAQRLCFVDSLSSFFGFSSVEDEILLRKKQQNSMLKSFQAAKRQDK